MTLRYSIIRINDIDYMTTELEAKTYSELADLQIKLSEELSAIIISLDKAKALPETPGRRHWINSAEHVRTIKGKQVDYLQRLMGAKKRKEKQERTQRDKREEITFDRAFVKAAYGMLPPEVFESIAIEARKEVERESVNE